MANSPRPKHPIEVIAAVVGFVIVCVVIVVFAFVVSPPALKPAPTLIQPTSSPVSSYQPEIIPLPTDMPEPTKTATVAPTNTPIPSPTPLVVPTLVSNSQLPDLIVSGISDPVCRPDYPGTILEFAIFVRNIGPASTLNFGSFDTDVYLILGQRHYSLDEWAEEFNGVIGSSVVEVFNLNPNDDIKFTVVIDLKGNKNFGIEVLANSGENPIREADMTNNTLIKYFSVFCY
ncbi:MAG TPA: hypothetical protein VJ987_00495 [Anaerolineales bacterium]|nr:hypothetical protein [Anaerolineales bacterium]